MAFPSTLSPVWFVIFEGSLVSSLFAVWKFFTKELLFAISWSLPWVPVTPSESSLQHSIPLIFFLKFWFIKAYANGLTAELNMTAVWAMGIAEGASLMSEKSFKRCNTESAPQHIPKIALTATTIKVTRFRTFTTPYINRNTILSY